MFQISTEETYQDGQIIFEEGNAGDWIYVIESGAVEIYKNINSEKIIIEIIGPGEVFGELAFLARIPRTATAKALGTTKVGVIDRDFLDEDYNNLSDSFRMILKSLVLRLSKATEKAAQPKLRRKEPRMPKVLSLHFKSKTGFIKAFSGDISGSGIFIKTEKPLAKGTPFLLKLKLPDSSEELMIKCEVCWTRTETNDPVKYPPGMGIKFTEISIANRQKLKEELIKAKSDIKSD